MFKNEKLRGCRNALIEEKISKRSLLYKKFQRIPIP